MLTLFTAPKSKLFSRFTYGELPNSIRTTIERIKAEWLAMRVDGKLTPQEFLDFSRDRIEELMAAVEALQSGATKKAVVLEVAAFAFDFFAPKIKFVPYFAWLGWLLGFPGARELFMLAVSNLIEIVFVEKFKPA